MGQAKNRGDFQARKDQAIVKKEQAKLQELEAIKKAKEDFLKLWDSWTEEEKEDFRQKRKQEQKKKQELAMLWSAMSMFKGI